MATNKHTTKSFCIKRLRDSGYTIDKLDLIEYTNSDKRKWSIIIDNGCSSIISTCMKDGTFKFYDGDRYFNSEICFTFSDMDNFITFLHKKGIVNKHYKYCRKEDK